MIMLRKNKNDLLINRLYPNDKKSLPIDCTYKSTIKAYESMMEKNALFEGKILSISSDSYKSKSSFRGNNYVVEVQSL
jgi:hypothetical protein